MFWMGVSGFLFVVLAVVSVRSWLLSRAKRGLVSAIAPRRRGLFRFSDGVNVREVDPIQVMLALEEDPEFAFDRHPARVLGGDSEAIKIVSAAVRRAFGVSAFVKAGEPGLTNRECWELYCTFMQYCDSQKKSTERLATYASSTDATFASSRGETTSDTSAFGLTGGEPRTSLAMQ